MLGIYLVNLLGKTTTFDRMRKKMSCLLMSLSSDRSWERNPAQSRQGYSADGPGSPKVLPAFWSRSNAAMVGSQISPGQGEVVINTVTSLAGIGVV